MQGQYKWKRDADGWIVIGEIKMFSIYHSYRLTALEQSTWGGKKRAAWSLLTPITFDILSTFCWKYLHFYLVRILNEEHLLGSTIILLCWHFPFHHCIKDISVYNVRCLLSFYSYVYQSVTFAIQWYLKRQFHNFLRKLKYDLFTHVYTSFVNSPSDISSFKFTCISLCFSHFTTWDNRSVLRSYSKCVFFWLTP